MSIEASTFHIISLGCAKNLVDSDSLAKLLNSQNFRSAESPRKAEFIIVNTCGFIHDARAESIQVLKEWSRRKRPGQKLIASGCMSQRYQADLLKDIPGIDGLMGTRNLQDILLVTQTLQGSRPKQSLVFFPEYASIQRSPGLPGYAIQGKSAYLKIADGCRRACAFCAIPMIKGPLVSRPINDILQDAQTLQSEGIKEINLIAQDVTDFGQDLGMRDGLTMLLSQLLPTIPDIPWVRLLYTFPGSISDGLIELMAESNQLLPYLDIPLQHADPEVLRAMHRPSDLEWIHTILVRMREQIPNLVIRTTMMVGFPNETKQSFENMKSFLREANFDHVGVFTYSPEENTPAHTLGDPVPAVVKEARREELMSLQAEISLKKNQQLIGQTLDVLIEGVDGEHHILVGRSYRDAPEIDGLVVIEGDGQVGELLPGQITGAMQHDLYGVLKSNQ
ncbi:MAG: 30S ribosomal protein S12 methylthiotransferase RimO [Anaerolineaceae bacterium]|jgi:ribosomal protein S12 methylthiotransferase